MTHKLPKYGDEVMIPSEHPDGHWTNGIVNSGYRGTEHQDGKLLVAALGHAKSNIVIIPLDGYKTAWCWPRDVGVRGSGAGKMVLLDEVQG